MDWLYRGRLYNNFRGTYYVCKYDVINNMLSKILSFTDNECDVSNISNLGEIYWLETTHQSTYGEDNGIGW